MIQICGFLNKPRIKTRAERDRGTCLSRQPLLDRLKPAFVFFIVGLIAATTDIVRAAQTDRTIEADMPTIMVDQYSGHAAWVDQSLAATDSGQVNDQIFDQAEIGMINGVLQQEVEDGCVHVHYSPPDFVFAPAREIIEDAIRTATVILRGRVTGKSYGFCGGVAGQLLRISTTDVLKGEASSPYYYSIFPGGRVKVGSREICQGAEPFARPPAVGEEVFLFTLRPWNYESYPIIAIHDPGDIVVVQKDGSLAMPSKFLIRTSGDRAVWAPIKAKPKSVEELESLIRRELARDKGAK